jgi:hypothetical protein
MQITKFNWNNGLIQFENKDQSQNYTFILSSFDKTCLVGVVSLQDIDALTMTHNYIQS